MNGMVAVEIKVLICVGFLLVHLKFGRTILQPEDVYVKDRQMLLAVFLALSLHCELDFGVLLVQKVSEAGDVLLFGHFYYIIYIPVPICRFDVWRIQTKSVTFKPFHLQVTSSWADVAPHWKTCCLFVKCTLKG